MKFKSIVLVAAVVCTAGSAGAQFIPDSLWQSWMAGHEGSGDGESNHDLSDLIIFAENATPDVVIEHWVVRQPTERGFRFGGLTFRHGARRYESASEFLEDMWRLSVEREEQWFYARQTVLYSPLERAVAGRWEYMEPPIACLRLIDSAGQVVGRQVRTEAWSLYTDHWVLYPEYWRLARHGEVQFVDDANAGCEWPGDLVAREFARARRQRNLAAYQYATATFALLPLKKSAAVALP